jgi:NTE family protein
MPSTLPDLPGDAGQPEPATAPVPASAPVPATDPRPGHDPDEGADEPFGLALSGGGIRATLFHLGALWRINEMGHLGDIDRISGVSGGSIAAGLLACAWPEFTWQGARATNFEARYATRVMRMARLPLDAPIVALGLVPGVSPAHILASVLDRVFFHGMTLQQLPAPGKGPRFVFNATDLATGTDFRFSRPYLGSYRLGLVRHPDTRVAIAVAASAAFPPLVSPLVMRFDPDDFEMVEGADLHGRREVLEKVALVDGGAYDNLALQPVASRCDKVLVSDAGGNLGVEPPTWKWDLWSLQIKRTLDIAVSQARALRRSALDADKAEHPYALWRTRSHPSDYRTVAPVFPVEGDWPAYLAALPTRLWPFPMNDRKRLVNWGYLLSDLALRAYIWPEDAAPTALPFPDAAFATPPERAPDLAGPKR